MVKRKLVFWTGFNKNRFGPYTERLHKSLSEGWISYRFDIWNKYTWKSIKRQTYADWVYCLSCDPLAKDITDRCFGQIADQRFHITYGGTDQEFAVMKEICRGKDEMVNIRIDSDDMYHPEVLEELNRALDEYDNDWFLWNEGFGYQYFSGKMKRYKPKHSSPFFAHRYKKVSDWLDKKGFKEGQHTHVMNYNPVAMDKGKIIVGLHGRYGNSSTSWMNKCFKNVIYGEEKSKILKVFKVSR